MDLKFRNIIVDQQARAGLMHKVLLFTIFFPFIPSIIRSADTQPTFTLLVLMAVSYQALKRESFFFELRNAEAFLAIFLGFLVSSSVILHFLASHEPFYITRIFAFAQFFLAVVFGLTYRFDLQGKDFKRVILVYFIFTFVYFITKGRIEDVLIGSRSDLGTTLLRQGRGAKTLSPEPAFFALQLFNIILLYRLLFGRKGFRTHETVLILMSSFCFLASFSGYGLLILMAVLFIRYKKFALISLAIVAILSPFLIQYLESFKYIRAVGLLVSVLTENPMLIIQHDHSIVVRLGSFLTYLNNIANNFLIGDGFSLRAGGGLISIVSSLGFVALIFFFMLIWEMLILRGHSAGTKILLLLWFILNLLSGPIGVPAIGIIVGLIIRNNHPSIFQTPTNKLVYAG